jgi:ferredoxin-NADP reductase
LHALAASDPRLTLQAIATRDNGADLDQLIPDTAQLRGIECYLCGSPGLIAALKQVLTSRGVTPRQIHRENSNAAVETLNSLRIIPQKRMLW